MNKQIGDEKNILFYNDEEGNTKVEVLLENEDVWLNVEALTKLFGIDRSGIVKHISNIYSDGELDENLTCAKIAQVKKEGTRDVKRVYSYYNIKNRYEKLLYNLKQSIRQFQGKQFRLIDRNGQEYLSNTPGTLGGNRKLKIYGRLDCPSAKRWIEKGYYISNRVF